MCHTMAGVGWVVLTIGTNLSNGQNRSQVTGPILNPTPKYLKDVTQEIPVSG